MKTRYIKSKQVKLRIKELKRQCTKEFLAMLDRKNDELIQEAITKLNRHKTRLTEL